MSAGQYGRAGDLFMKSGKARFAAWKQRHAVLEGEELAYWSAGRYRKATGGATVAPTGKFHVQGVYDVPTPYSGAASLHRIDVLCAGGHIVSLATSTVEDKAGWLAALERPFGSASHRLPLADHPRLAEFRATAPATVEAALVAEAAARARAHAANETLDKQASAVLTAERAPAGERPAGERPARCRALRAAPPPSA